MVSLPEREITRIYTVYPNVTVELEVRFGSYTGREFHSGVSQQVFNRVMTAFEEISKPKITETTDSSGANDVRRTEYTDGRVEWIRKTRRYRQDIIPYGIRVDMNTEEPIAPVPNFVSTYTRQKKRFAFPALKGSATIDMTIVTSGNDVSYEIEVELIDRTKLASFKTVVEYVLTRVQDTIVPYTPDEKSRIIDYVNKTLLGSPREYNTVDDSILVQARNLMMNDLVWGGVIGNKDTAYTTTIKADGIRKLLVFSPWGIWMVMSPTSTSLLFAEPIPELTGTILDGEIIPRLNRLAGAPNSIYWYIPFDCLSSKGDWRIQERTLAERQDVAKKIVPRYPTMTTGTAPRLTMSSKPFDLLDLERTQWRPNNWKDRVSAFFATMEHTFVYLRRIDQQWERQQQDKKANRPIVSLFTMEELPESLRFKSDGMILTPTNTYYQPQYYDPVRKAWSRTDSYPLRQRVLTEMPDLCKWKPREKMTIDFTIYRDERGIIHLYSIERGQLVPFQGSNFYPLTDGVDTEHPFTKNVSDGTIVEYRYDATKEQLVPERTRSDRVKPNSMETAISNWDWIMDPITEAILTGHAFYLVFRYHNRIKGYLIDNAMKQGTPGERKSILNIGAGRGGDSRKMKGARVVEVEPNRDYIPELIRRTLSARPDETVIFIDLIGGDEKLIIELRELDDADRLTIVPMSRGTTCDEDNGYSSCITFRRREFEPDYTVYPRIYWWSCRYCLLDVIDVVLLAISGNGECPGYNDL